MKQFVYILIFQFLIGPSFSQKDTLIKGDKLPPHSNSNNNIIILGQGKTENADSNANGKLIISGYVSAYYAYYDDEAINKKGFVKFATMAPRIKEFGLNMALVSMNYKNKNLRGAVGVHFGDIPKSVWPSEYNMIQEANAGFRVCKKLWIDAGFFRSHIGIESTQPRQNIASSMALASLYEPYYLAGAKLTYELNDKIAVQLNSFNSFNSYVETNKNTLVGLSLVINPSKNISLTYNFMTGDETPTGAQIKKQRFYNNIYASCTANKFYLGAEFNYGWQEHSKINDVNLNAIIMSGIIIGKYQLHKKINAYARQEYFSDPNNVLTTSLSTGKNVFGSTAGFEYKPFKNISLSVEGRVLQSDNLIFKQGAFLTNRRLEGNVCLDLWF